MAGCAQIECFTLENTLKNDWLQGFRQQTGAMYALKSGKGWATRESVNDIVSIISDPKSMDPRVPESMDYIQKNYKKTKKRDFEYEPKQKKIAVNGASATFKSGKLYDVKLPERKFMGDIADYMKVLPEYNAPIYNLAELIHRYEETYGLNHSYTTPERLYKFFQQYEEGLKESEFRQEALNVIEPLTKLYGNILSKPGKYDALNLSKYELQMFDYIAENSSYYLKDYGYIEPAKATEAILALLPEYHADYLNEIIAQQQEILFQQREAYLNKTTGISSSDDEYADRTGIDNQAASGVRVVGDVREVWRNPVQAMVQAGDGYEAMGTKTNITENTGQGDRRDLRPGGGFQPDRTEAPPKVDEDPRR